ncbi:MAG: hypothetical protein OXT09_35665, partial [Myxococcales bacterium]|nr:hypothetical protein [Myxococcales bacterium]
DQAEAGAPTPAAHLDPGDESIPFYGFCPEEGTAPQGSPHPQLFELARVHSEELLDRFVAMRRARRGSKGLREGLRDVLAARDVDAALAKLAAAPDRFEGPFDYARGAAVLLGMRALGKNPQLALQRGRYATAAAVGPDGRRHEVDPAAHALVALAARTLGDPKVERTALRNARVLDPEEPAFNLALGQNLAHTPHVAEAIDALDGYLRSTRDDVGSAQLRARLATARDIQREYELHHRGVVTLQAAPGALPEDMDAPELTALLQQSLEEAAEMLGMRPRPELHAIVYRDRSELLATTCVPTWSAGVFDGTLRLYAGSLKDPAARRRVVRHEVLHAQLRAGRFPAPHWFHEGVAQHFAEETRRAHLRSYAMMVDNRTYIPFASLEGSFLVINRGGDARLAYHQSLAMVELMIDRAGKRAIAHAVDYLRRDGDPKDLLEYVTAPRPVDGDDLLSYLSRKLRSQPR